MSRVNLNEFRPIDFASFVPEQDPNNALVPRIAMTAKALHELPWFKDDDEEGKEEVSETSYEQVSDIAKNPKIRKHFMNGLDPNLSKAMNPKPWAKKNITVDINGMRVNTQNPFALSEDEADLNKKRSELDDWRNAFSDWSKVSFEELKKDKDLAKSFQEFVGQNGNKIVVDGIAGPKTKKAYNDLFNEKNKDQYESAAKKRIYGDVEDTGEDLFAENPYIKNLDFISSLFDYEE